MCGKKKPIALIHVRENKPIALIHVQEKKPIALIHVREKKPIALISFSKMRKLFDKFHVWTRGDLVVIISYIVNKVDKFSKSMFPTTKVFLDTQY